MKRGESAKSHQSPITEALLRHAYETEHESAAQIARKHGCSENKINYWLNAYGIKKRSIADALYLRHNPNGDPFTFTEPTTRANAFLFGLGIGLYWGEGNKRNKTAVRLGNSDPDLVRAFLAFLEKIFRVRGEKIRFGLQLFSDVNPSEALAFWTKQLRVSRKQFGKTIVTPARGDGTYRQKSKYGVVTVYVSNIRLRNLLCGEIEKLRLMR